MTFASNYDGAVEAYNDDFIDQVWWGLNAAFGNAAGYPPTRWLLWGGAKYEQQFKNTLRIHQVPVPLWYSAYPGSARPISRTTPRSGPACAVEMSPAAAERWLSLL